MTETTNAPTAGWRERAGRIVLDPNDPHGEPLTTPTDRRWLWRIESFLAINATTDGQKQLATDLRQYLGETCDHHWHEYAGDDVIPAHEQCLWCYTVRDAR